MIETKVLLAYSFNTPTYECLCIYILTMCIYTHICPYRHMSICTYSWIMFNICSLKFCVNYRIVTQTNNYNEK